ncbi:Hypothetical predicted protein [Lecanosticta acicola]|uniref:Uncharacterized protein n=1 Tax=Lecanosticta acicola TaxID=111012 RepID=A0AAI8YXI3_9PEZI|nr:Hypothetical predicted protein [Lecanosticta acicola]
MVHSLITSLALFGASATALSVGSAHVVNQCSYDVYLCNVPASGGGYEESDQTLSAGNSWTQQWTELSNGDGWSIKLSHSTALENILQYEYTFHNDGIIWYDLSCVNGNPWDQDWEITSSTDSCSPKQQAYRYATDDAYGMQACSQDASITVTLCSGVSQDNGTAITSASSYGSDSSSDSSSSSSSYFSSYSSSDSGSDSSSSSSAAASAYSAPASSAASSTAAPASSAAPSYSSNSDNDESPAAPSSTSAPVSYGYDWYGNDGEGQSSTPTPTTFATSTTATSVDNNGVIVTDVETVVVTNMVTQTAIAYGPNSRVKRQQHQHEHEHHVHGHQHRAA